MMFSDKIDGVLCVIAAFLLQFVIDYLLKNINVIFQYIDSRCKICLG